MNDCLILIGGIPDHLGQSAFFREILQISGEKAGPVPKINFQHEKKLANFIQTINQKNLIVGGHDISDGGLLLALAEICILNGIGFILNSEDPRWLFGENQGLYLIICKKQNEMTIIEEAKVNNVPFEKLGYFNNGLFKIGKETTQIDELKKIFDNGLDELIN